jgi:hypothetical protein
MKTVSFIYYYLLILTFFFKVFTIRYTKRIKIFCPKLFEIRAQAIVQQKEFRHT